MDFFSVQRPELLSDFFILVGIIVVIRTIWSNWTFVKVIIWPDKGLLDTAGGWAVITGCTNGIGKEFALQLAERGHNVCLISRNKVLLAALGADIERRYSVKTKEIVVDFDCNSGDIYDMIESELSAIDVGVLVNNVGISPEFPDFHHISVTSQLCLGMINVNMIAMAKMCKIVLPGMIGRGRGLVINISSTACRLTNPLVSLYGATKTFVDVMSMALHREYKSKGIYVQSVTPGIVSTNMTKNAQASVMIPSARTYVRSCLRTVGIRARTYGYWLHTLQGTFFHILPDSVKLFVVKCSSRWFQSLDQQQQKNRQGV